MCVWLPSRRCRYLSPLAVDLYSECVCEYPVEGVFTFLLLRWMSPMLLARELGPSRVAVLWGQSTVTSVCSPIRTLRTFSAPVTRISGRPSRWVLNTLPYFCRLDAWKPEPWGERTAGIRSTNSVFFPSVFTHQITFKLWYACKQFTVGFFNQFTISFRSVSNQIPWSRLWSVYDHTTIGFWLVSVMLRTDQIRPS